MSRHGLAAELGAQFIDMPKSAWLAVTGMRSVTPEYIRNKNKKHSWCCGTPEPRIFIARCRNWRKHIIIIYRCSRYIKYFHLLPWSTIASGVRNQLAKFGYSALSTFRDIGLRIWKRFCVIQTNGVSNSDQIWRRCIRGGVQSTVQIWCIYV